MADKKEKIRKENMMGNHHHKLEAAYRLERYPYLFYFEEAVDGWIPVPERIDEIISVVDSLEKDEKIEIQFQRFDLTDEEFDKLPVDWFCILFGYEDNKVLSERLKTKN